jgi:hypothetical protein
MQRVEAPQIAGLIQANTETLVATTPEKTQGKSTQKPAEKTEVLLGIKGIPGIGKSIIMETLMPNMLGEDLIVSVANADRDIWGDFNYAIHNKLIVNMEESKVKSIDINIVLFKSTIFIIYESNCETYQFRYTN